MLSQRDLLGLRLRSLLLAGNGSGEPVRVVRHLLAMQAQDFPASMWAVGMRSQSTLADVEKAYLDGQIVRSWPMRGTLHALPAEDVGWMQRLTSAKVLGASAERRRTHLGLERQLIERVRECVVDLLAGGRAASRDVLLGEVAARGVNIEAHWKYHLIWFLAQTGTLVFGPVAEGEPLLVLADEWIKQPRDLGREEALAELAASYVASHGPVTVDDLAWWSGLGKREIAEGLTLAGDQVARIESDSRSYWIAPKLTDPVRPIPPSVDLLPAFDEHLLGYRDRTAMLDPAHAPSICPGGNGIFKPVVTVDGVCAGTWRAASRSALNKLPADRRVPITVTWFNPTTGKTVDPKLLVEAATNYAHYLGKDQAKVTVSN
ncbi:MAG: winged helix DNA-binding domain-containing protein [Propionibacteriaceae bacterium]|jgi:hypothetical protein|nr:winged helix DNA-binding domain-containing protein [Propionibacteriaceae bacterium]